MPLSILQILNIARVSQYLSAVDVNKGSLFGARVTPLTPRILYMERKAVETFYNLDPTNSTLTQTANYLYSLCRGYNLQAQGILTGGSGGSVSPISPSMMPSPYEFEVSGSSFIATGESSKTITSFIGFNILFVRNNIPQSTVDIGGGTSYCTWNKTLGLFTISPSANAGELFQIYPL